MAPSFYHNSPVPMVDDLEGSMLTRRKLPLWLVLFLLFPVVVGLLVPLIYFAVRANSKGCVDGLQAQKECREVNQHLQRQLNQAQEISHEKETEAATCNSTVVTLRESLKKEQAQVAEFQGELRILNQNLKDALAEVERLRSQSETSSKNNASSYSSFLFVVIAFLVLNALLT
ncbi:bone marrow stromal antigen 2 isoform X2 [Moschus berezovskii]|uniref:bone marrow stromal antigen 2 isoform X2 n=1 Tax=Moschus berezovskii TaxID=68408 RepID=UPI002443BA38|nr:bone marrow stromal antigen 2 isoform X2 [Moschus berezovskii]